MRGAGSKGDGKAASNLEKKKKREILQGRFRKSSENPKKAIENRGDRRGLRSKKKRTVDTWKKR